MPHIGRYLLGEFSARLHEERNTAHFKLSSNYSRRCPALPDLRVGMEDRGHSAALHRHGVELRDKPIVVAGARRGGKGKAAAVRRPIVFVDIQIGGRDLLRGSGSSIDNGQPLVMDLASDYARFDRLRFERSSTGRGALGKQKGDSRPVGGPARIGKEAVEACQLSDRSTSGLGNVELRLLFLDAIR